MRMIIQYYIVEITTDIRNGKKNINNLGYLKPAEFVEHGFTYFYTHVRNIKIYNR